MTGCNLVCSYHLSSSQPDANRRLPARLPDTMVVETENADRRFETTRCKPPIEFHSSGIGRTALVTSRTSTPMRSRSGRSVRQDEAVPVRTLGSRGYCPLIR